MPAILGLQFPRGPMWGNQVHAVLLEGVIEAVTVIGTIANGMLRFGFEHVKVETQLQQGDFMMIRRMRTDGERKPMAIHNRQDFHAFAAFGEADSLTAALRGLKGGIDETLAFVDCPFVPQRIRQLGEDVPQHLALTPLLKPAMHCFLVRIALRQEMPLGAGVQNPEHGLQDRSGRHGFAAGMAVRDVLFREVLPNSFPLVVTQAKHARTYKDESSGRQLF